MEYIVKFNFSSFSKRGLVSFKKGEVDITTDELPEKLMKSNELIELITKDMSSKTKQSIISVDILEVLEKKKVDKKKKI